MQELTLDEYEKVLEEKRKELNSQKGEKRTVEIDAELAKLTVVTKKVGARNNTCLVVPSCVRQMWSNQLESSRKGRIVCLKSSALEFRTQLHRNDRLFLHCPSI